LSASLALFVGVSALGPWAASAVPAPDPAWESSVDAEPATGASAGAATSPDAAGQQETGAAPKRKGNAFGRAITAPFRALARLFGGNGRKRTSVAKKQAAPEQAPAPEAARSLNPNLAARPELGSAALTTVTPANWPAVAPVGPVIAADASAPSGPTVQPRSLLQTSPAVQPSSVIRPGPVTQAPAGEAGTRIVRPAETAAPSLLPKPFIPVIEGVARDPLSQGRALLQEGYLTQAVSELSVAATTVGPDSNLVEANNLLGLAYDRLGSHREATEAYRRALTVAPSDPVILANLGYSLYLSNDFDGALRHLKQAARISPSLNIVHNNLGIVQARLGRYDEALRSFARASNQYDAHLKVAGILEFEKRDRQAAKHYEAALRLQPNTSAVLERLVAIYERTGQRDKAETARRALGQPTNPQRTTTGGGG
jgi:Flp pilus assembly protein TadD